MRVHRLHITTAILLSTANLVSCFRFARALSCADCSSTWRRRHVATGRANETYSDQTASWSSQTVVKSKRILPKMDETFRLRIYFWIAQICISHRIYGTGISTWMVDVHFIYTFGPQNLEIHEGSPKEYGWNYPQQFLVVVSNGR